MRAWPASFRAALEMGAALSLDHPCSVPTCPCFGRCRDSVSISAGFFSVEGEEQGGEDSPQGHGAGEAPHALALSIPSWAVCVAWALLSHSQTLFLPRCQAGGANAGVELFCLVCSSPQVGFLRFLSLLVTFDWNNNPLIVNLNAGLAGEQAARVPGLWASCGVRVLSPPLVSPWLWGFWIRGDSQASAWNT